MTIEFIMPKKTGDLLFEVRRFLANPKHYGAFKIIPAWTHSLKIIRGGDIEGQLKPSVRRKLIRNKYIVTKISVFSNTSALHPTSDIYVYQILVTTTSVSTCPVCCYSEHTHVNKLIALEKLCIKRALQSISQRKYIEDDGSNTPVG